MSLLISFWNDLAVQDDVDIVVDVGDVHLLIKVDVGAAIAVVLTAQDDVNQHIDVGNVDLTVTVHVTTGILGCRQELELVGILEAAAEPVFNIVHLLADAPGSFIHPHLLYLCLP